MYIKELNGANPVDYKFKVSYCPPDCGGEELDEGEYAPYCPCCHTDLELHEHENYCYECGTKLYWEYNYPSRK